MDKREGRPMYYYVVKGTVSMGNTNTIWEVIVTGTRKCDYPFKLWGKPVCNREGWGVEGHIWES